MPGTMTVTSALPAAHTRYIDRQTSSVTMNDCDCLEVERRSVPGSTWTDLLVEPLTARELDVLELLMRGAGNREIADALTISPRTVETHLTNIYGKLGVRTRTEAILRAVSEGLSQPQPIPALHRQFVTSFTSFTLIIQQRPRSAREGDLRPRVWSSW